MPAVNLQMRNVLLYENLVTGERLEAPGFTCVHCGRSVVANPERQRPREVCRSCMALVCDYCVRDCQPFARDADRAYNDQDGQPWMLRDYGEPVDRIFLPDGTSTLVRRNDHGYTLRENRRNRRT